MKLCLLLLALLFSPLAQATKIVGNGGDAIVCSPPGVRPVEMLDAFEAREIHKMTLDMGAAGLTYQDKVVLILNRIARLNPHRAALYSKWAKSFESETNFIVNEQIIQVPDVGPAFIPIGCQLVQTAVQQDPELPEDFRYTIRKDIWDAMDADNKAILVLHEMIYREVLGQETEQGAGQNSKLVRYFNGYIASDKLKTDSLNAYIGILRLVNLYTADAQNSVPIELISCGRGFCNENQTSFYSDNLVSVAKLDFSSIYSSSFSGIWRGISFSSMRIDRYDGGSINFNADGSVPHFIVANQAFDLNLSWIRVHAAPGTSGFGIKVYDDLKKLRFEANDGTIILQLQNGSKKKCQSLSLDLVSRKILDCINY